MQTKFVSYKLYTQKLSQLWRNFAIFVFIFFMWQRFYEHLKLKLCPSTFEIDNIRCNISLNFCIHYSNRQLFMHYYNKDFYMLYCSYWLFYSHKCYWQILLPLFLYASLQITHLLLTTTSDLLFNLLWWTFSSTALQCMPTLIFAVTIENFLSL